MDYINFVKEKKGSILKVIIFIATIILVVHLFKINFHGGNVIDYLMVYFIFIFFIYVLISCQIYFFNNRILSLGIKRLITILSVIIPIIAIALVEFRDGIDFFATLLLFYGVFWLLAAASSWVYNGFISDAE